MDQDPASSQVQGLLLKTGLGGGPKLQLCVTSEAHTGAEAEAVVWFFSAKVRVASVGFNEDNSYVFSQIF